MQNQITIITYHFPPLNHIASKRPFYFAKSFIENGWKVNIITCKHIGEYSKEEKDVIENLRIYEVSDVLARKKKEVKESLPLSLNKQKFIIRILKLAKKFLFSIFFFPDVQQFWSIKVLLFLIKNNKQLKSDYIFTTSPPYSIAIAGSIFCRLFAKKHIVDFRDSWSNNRNIFPRRKSLYYFFSTVIEKRLYENCFRFSAVQNDCIVRNENSKFLHILNGFPDLRIEGKREFQNSFKKLRIGYFGSFYGQSNPDTLLSALSILKKEYTDIDNSIKLNIFGNVFDYPLNKKLKNYNLQNLVHVFSKVAYEKVFSKMAEHQLLLLVIRPNTRDGKDSVYSGKLFDYLIANRPILAIVPHNSVVRDVLLETNTGVAFDHSQASELAEYLLNIFNSKSISYNPDIKAIQKYSRNSQNSILINSIKEDEKLGN